MMFLKPRGSITIFLCIILAVLIPLICIFIDLARISSAKSQAKSALKLCTESMLAGYDRQLKEQYGLFSLYPQDTETMEKEIYELLCMNLNTGASVEGVSDLYGFKIKKVEVIPFYNYSEPFVLHQQAAEFMKYRAPVQAVQEFYEKIKVMMGLIKEGDMIDRKMSLDKLMYDIRSNLVKIDCTINGVLKRFNSLNEENKTTLKESKLAGAKINISRAQNHIQDANGYVEPIEEARAGYQSIYGPYIRAKNEYESLLSQVRGASSKLEAAKEKLANVKGDKTALEAEITSLQSSYDAISSSCSAAYEPYASYEREINGYRRIIDEGLNFVIPKLDGALKANIMAADEISKLKEHTEVYILYHKDLLNSIKTISPKFEKLDKDVQALKKDTGHNESSISDTINASLEKQLKSIQADTFEGIKDRLTLNLQKLEMWDQAIKEKLDVVNRGTKDLSNTLKSAEEVKAEPQDTGKEYKGYGGYADITAAFGALETDLSDLKSIGSMKDIYEVPAYSLEPRVNATEKEAYEKWFAEHYRGEKPKQEDHKDDSDLKKLRKGAGRLADSAAELGTEATNEFEGLNADPESIEERWKNLPSMKGATSSGNAIARIGRAIQESRENQVINENPFEKPVEGLDTVNEEEKNFFNFEVERIGKLLNTIGGTISDNMENLIESLYINEYIVSAFQCETAVNGIEHDIGRERPLDRSFFKQAEVEYILFGNKTVKENINAVKRSIFAARLLFNLLHVYTDAEKLSTAASLASIIAGWTIFGIPIVQNFILIAWAGAESYIDTDLICKGKSVPLIKTSSSWQLGAGSLKDKLLDILTGDIKNFLQEKTAESVDNASEAVQETVEGVINGLFDQVFAPFENGLDELPGQADDGVALDINTLLSDAGQTFIDTLRFHDMDSFTTSLKTAADSLVNTISGQIKGYSQEKLLHFKNGLKKEIKNLIFESSEYKSLEENLKKIGNDLINKGMSAMEEKLDDAFGAVGKSERNNITGRLIMMDYVDYLRLILLAVPAQTKALRTADLMQLNMQEAANEQELSIDRYNTYLFIKVELDINTWFIPESVFKKENAGMIAIEWSQGY